MKFIEIKELAYNLIDETDLDPQVEIIVSNSINEAYLDLCKKDVRLSRAYVPVINGIATLPEDLIKIESCVPELTGTDRIVGKNIITEKQGVLEILYSALREPLISDEEEPDLDLTLQYALANFACYKYFLYRKKIDVASGFLNSFESYVFKYEQANSPNEVGYIRFIEEV